MPIYKSGGKKDGLQRYTVRVSFYDERGKHDRMRVAYGRAEALQLEQDLKKSIKKEPSSRKVEEFYNDYIAVKKSEVRETTLDKMVVCFKHHILPYIGDVPVSKLTAPLLEKRWRTPLSESSLKVTSKNNVYRDLRAFLNYLVRTDALPESPLKKVDRFRDPYEIPTEGKIQYYTPEEFRTFISTAESIATTPMQKGLVIFFKLAYFTGARKGELNALKWSDVDGDKLMIRRSVNLKGKSPRETPPKNKTSFRTLQMPRQLVEALADHKAFHMSFEGFSESWRVCGGDGFLGDTYIDTFNRDVASRANLHRIRVHDFRHSHASLLANNGINIQEIARRLGHSNVQETWKTYAHLYPKEEERAIAVLESVTTF